MDHLHQFVHSIFIIDDDAMIRRILATALNRYQITCFSEGSLAIKYLRENPTIKMDLTISDFGMPNADGVETLKAIRRLVPSSKLMLISGTISDDLEAVCSQNYFDQYLTKPFSIAELQDVVAKVLLKKPSLVVA